MTNNEIVANNIDLIKLCCSHQVRKYDTPPEFLDDIVQDTCVTLLEYDNEKLNKIVKEDHLNAFITGILVRQLYSTNSQTYRIYRRLRELSNEVTEDVEPADPKSKSKKEPPAEKLPYYPEDFEVKDDDTEEMTKIKQSIATLSPGERNIFLSYCENPNLTAFAKQLKVTPSLLRNYINNVKNKIKTECTSTCSSYPLF
jgi:RNA polymerase sigma factor (sigma-70 family)